MDVTVTDPQTRVRFAAFIQARRLSERCDHLTAEELSLGFEASATRFSTRAAASNPRQKRHLTTWIDT